MEYTEDQKKRIAANKAEAHRRRQALQELQLKQESSSNFASSAPSSSDRQPSMSTKENTENFNEKTSGLVHQNKVDSSSSSSIKRKSAPLDIRPLGSSQDTPVKRSRKSEEFKTPSNPPTAATPSTSSTKRGKTLCSVSDEMILNPTKFDGTVHPSKSWMLIRELIKLYPVQPCQCDQVRNQIGNIGKERCQKIIDGIRAPETCQLFPRSESISIKRAFIFFAKIVKDIFSHSVVEGCPKNNACINLLHWTVEPTFEKNRNEGSGYKYNARTSTPYIAAAAEQDNENVEMEDAMEETEFIEPGEESLQTPIDPAQIQGYSIGGYSFAVINKGNNKYLVCKDCTIIGMTYMKFAKFNNCQVEIPTICRLRLDAATGQIFGNPQGPGGEMHACQNPKYQEKKPVILHRYESAVILGKEVEFQPEHQEVIKKLQEISPKKEDEYLGICYFISRFMVAEHGYTVSSGDGYVGFSQIKDENIEPLQKRFKFHLDYENREEKIGGAGELHIVEIFRGSSIQAQHLEYLNIGLKRKLKNGATSLTNQNTGNCFSKTIDDMLSPSHPFHETLVKGLNQMLEHGLNYGSRLPASRLAK